MANLIENKKAHADYEILEKLEAGVELLGFEVKSLRNHQGSLKGARVIVRGGEAFLIGASIPPFQPSNTPKSYDSARNRRLLLNKKEILSLAQSEDKRGLTIIPISVYNRGKRIKISLGIAKGKKKYDKRESLKKREAQREIDRSLKNNL